MKSTDPLQTRGKLTTAFGTYSYYRLSALAAARGYDLARLPFSIRVLLENNLRHYDGMKEFPVRLCINTPAELAYFKEGGLLTAFAKSVLRQ